MMYIHRITREKWHLMLSLMPQASYLYFTSIHISIDKFTLYFLGMYIIDNII